MIRMGESPLDLFGAAHLFQPSRFAVSFRTGFGLPDGVVGRAIAPHRPENAGEFSSERDDGDSFAARFREPVPPLANGVVDVARAKDEPCGLDVRASAV